MLQVDTNTTRWRNLLFLSVRGDIVLNTSTASLSPFFDISPYEIRDDGRSSGSRRPISQDNTCGYCICTRSAGSLTRSPPHTYYNPPRQLTSLGVGFHIQMARPLVRTSSAHCRGAGKCRGLIGTLASSTFDADILSRRTCLSIVDYILHRVRNPGWVDLDGPIPVEPMGKTDSIPSHVGCNMESRIALESGGPTCHLESSVRDRILRMDQADPWTTGDRCNCRCLGGCYLRGDRGLDRRTIPQCRKP